MFNPSNITIRQLGVRDYIETWQTMQNFNQTRDASTPDQIWIVEHPPVYTLGLNGKREHILNPQNIPIVQTDRGGQITYHGPGQLVIYPLLALERYHLNIRQLVSLLEQAMVSSLAQYGIKAFAKPEAPGVYVDEQKIGSIGLRIKRGCCYHGLSLNNQMDLSPFDGINTCGFPDMKVTQLADLGVHIHTHELAVPVTYAMLEALS